MRYFFIVLILTIICWSCDRDTLPPDLDAVGMMGHSFGGYTALSIAGGTIDFDNLAQDCQQDALEALNPSLLLQCQAQRLPKDLPDLSDARIKSVVVTHPITSALFGPKGLASVDIPILMFSGGQDIVALPISEQIRPFSFLASRQKYFILMEEASHFSPIGDLPPEDRLIDVSLGGDLNSDFPARQALKVLGLSFFETHLNNHDANFDELLYSLSTALNQPTFPLFPLNVPVQVEMPPKPSPIQASKPLSPISFDSAN